MLLGGDFLGFIERRDGSLAFVIGDVAGRGPAAAGLGAALRAGWRALVEAGVELKDLLPGLARLLSAYRDALPLSIAEAPTASTRHDRCSSVPALISARGRTTATTGERRRAPPASPVPRLSAESHGKEMSGASVRRQFRWSTRSAINVSREQRSTAASQSWYCSGSVGPPSDHTGGREHILDFRPRMRGEWVPPQGERPRSRSVEGATRKAGSY